MPLLWSECYSMSRNRVVSTQNGIRLFSLSLCFFFPNFESMFIKSRNSETRKGLRQKKK